MQLSPEAQKIYDNVILDPKPVVNSNRLNIVNLATVIRATEIELILDPTVLQNRENALRNKMLEIFNESVKQGWLEHGVFSKIKTKALAETDLSTAKLVYFMVFSKFSLKELNKLAVDYYGLKHDEYVQKIQQIQGGDFPGVILFENEWRHTVPFPGNVWEQLGVKCN